LPHERQQRESNCKDHFVLNASAKEFWHCAIWREAVEKLNVHRHFDRVTAFQNGGKTTLNLNFKWQ